MQYSFHEYFIKCPPLQIAASFLLTHEVDPRPGHRPRRHLPPRRDLRGRPLHEVRAVDHLRPLLQFVEAARRHDNVDVQQLKESDATGVENV